MASQFESKKDQMSDWHELTRMTQGESIIIERIQIPSRRMTIEGHFDLPPLARLSTEDQVFVAAFVRAHGSIKEMERLFGTSYPSIKNRLNRISGQLGFLSVHVPETTPDTENETREGLESPKTILDRLQRGEISASEAVERLRK